MIEVLWLLIGSGKGYFFLSLGGVFGLGFRRFIFIDLCNLFEMGLCVCSNYVSVLGYINIKEKWLLE